MRDLRNAVDGLRVTLSSIGDGVATTDERGHVTMLNPVAQTLTGWTEQEAIGRNLKEVFHIVNHETRDEVENPALRCLTEGVIVGLANHTLLISKDGTERPIDDSAAPIRNEKGEIAGAVLVFRDITERYRQERLIKDAMDYASNILETQREPFLVLSGDLRIVSANLAFYQTFGVERAATEGRYVYELGDGQWNIPRLRILLEEVLPRDNVFEGFEVDHEFEGIGRKTMLLNARRVRRPGNHSELILLAIEDITDRRAVELALRAKEERYGTLFNSIDEGFAIIELVYDASGKAFDYRFIEVNPAFAKQSGIPDAVGKRILELVPAIEPIWVETYARVVATGEPIRIELLVKELDNSWFDIYAARVGGPETRRVAVLFTNTTERNRSEHRVQVSEVRYRRLFESAKDGILILDALSGQVIDANAFMASLVGLTSDKLIGKELYEIGMFADVEANKEAFRELQSTGYIRYEHLPVRNQLGKKVQVEFVANVYHEGDQLVAQCNVRDISERVRMETKIAEQARAMADESQRKDEFLAMLSHELRSPLAPIRSAVYLLKMHERGNDNPVQQQAREIIERQVGHLTNLVNDLLEVARLVSGRIRLDLRTLDLNQVVRRAVESVTPLMVQHKHTLKLHLCDEGTGGGVWVNADATRLEEVFLNILTNAAKYTPDGGLIEVRCEQPKDASHARVRVIDNGVGIDKELLPHIFDLFTQADRSLDRSQGRLGIGLSLAHRLVNLHGGTLDANSPPKDATSGSEFIVSLRLALPPQPMEPPTTFALPAQRIDGTRVLVVDDNIDLVLMLTSTLRQKGFAVQSAYNGIDGLKVALQWRADVVLLDIGLPGLNGYEVARQLRTSSVLGFAGESMRLIALTGYGRETDVALAKEAGFDAHLTKPANFDELLLLMEAPMV